MLESRYGYRHQVIPQQPDTWDNFVPRLQDIIIIGDKPLVPKEVIPSNLKYQIFGESTQNLLRFLERRDISTPDDNLMDRLMVVNDHDFEYLNRVDKSHPLSGFLGSRLSNRLCIANADAISRKASKEKVNFEDLLCIVGTHEIVHTLTYQELWISHDTPNEIYTVGQGRNMRRDGVGTIKPHSFSKAYFHSRRRALALEELGEGIIQYITASCVSSAQNEYLRQHDIYSEATQSIYALMSQIGERPFLQATFTREGFRDLYKAVERKYGKGQFRTLLNVLIDKSNQPLNERLHDQRFIP